MSPGKPGVGRLEDERAEILAGRKEEQRHLARRPSQDVLAFFKVRSVVRHPLGGDERAGAVDHEGDLVAGLFEMRSSHDMGSGFFYASHDVGLF